MRLDVFLPGIILLFLYPAMAAGEAVPEAAPPLSVERVLAGPSPEELSWEELRGEAVVIDFWATWCVPCIVALPHWNELVEEFAEAPIRFLSITDETPGKVAEFLERRPIAGWLALDPDKSVFDGFGVRAIPHTVLIDAEGRLRAVTRPLSLDREALKALLEGKTPKVNPLPSLAVPLSASRGEAPETLEKKKGFPAQPPSKAPRQ